MEEDAAAAASAKARADQLMADAEVAAAERRMQAAELELKGALAQEAALEAAAGRVSTLIRTGRVRMQCINDRVGLAWGGMRQCCMLGYLWGSS